MAQYGVSRALGARTLPPRLSPAGVGYLLRVLLPCSRGPISESLIGVLRGELDTASLAAVDVGQPADPLVDDDLQVSLWICYELFYRGFDDVDDQYEWEPAIIALRRALDKPLLEQLRNAVEIPASESPVADRLRALVDADDGPQLSRYLQREATSDQFLEFVVHRSIYQVKEADPHTWAIPRLDGRPKAALVEIQVDEYGAGSAERMHSELYRKMMRGLGLDDTYGAYVNAAPALTLAISNVMSMFGLQRELRGAVVGHLAAYEMTSSEPCRRYAKGLRRIGADDATCEFFDAHVTADALHEQLAAHDLCGGLAEDEPQLSEDIIFGAAACLYVDGRFGAHVLDSWREHRTSLRPPDTDLRRAG